MGVVFRIGGFLDYSGLHRFRNGSGDDPTFRDGAGLVTTFRGCWVGSSFVSNWEMEWLPAHTGDRSDEHYRGNRDAALSAIRRRSRYFGGWHDTGGDRYLSIGGVDSHAVSQLGLVARERNRSVRVGRSVGAGLANRQPHVSRSLCRN